MNTRPYYLRQILILILVSAGILRFIYLLLKDIYIPIKKDKDDQD